jgi:hypothetical protein
MARPPTHDALLKQVNELAKEQSKLHALLRSHSEKIDGFNNKLDSMEETLYCMNSNIKRNQFLHMEELNDQNKS